MAKNLLCRLLLLAVCVTLLLLPAPGKTEAAAAGGLPFVANQGQFAETVRFRWQGEGYVGWVTNDDIWLTHLAEDPITIRLSWPALAEQQPRGVLPHPTRHSYFYGPSEASWYRDVPTWSALQWGPWQLVDQGGGLSIDGPAVDDLIWTSAAPVTYDGERFLLEGANRSLPIRFVRGAAASNQLGPGPAAGFGTFIGAGLWDQADALAVDPAGNSYSSGYTTSITFPAVVGAPLQHGIDIFLSKLNTDGSALDYVLHVNPNPQGLDTGQDYGQALAVDAGGHAVLAGRTDSPDFPRTAGSYEDQFQGPTDAYVLKFTPDGTDLIYGTFLNGENFDDARALALDAQGHAYVGGGTFSADFLPAGLPGFDLNHAGERDGFVVKLAPDGGDLLWGSYLGGSSQETVTSLDLGADGAVYLGGWTRSANDFPLSNGSFDASFGGDFDGFVTVLEPTGADLRYSSYVGGGGEDRVSSVAVAANGEVVAGGLTVSPDLGATVGAFDETCGTDGNCDESGGFTHSDGFVLRLNRAGSAAMYLTYLGGELADEIMALDLDDLNRPVLTGRTLSSGFPTTPDALDGSLSGAVDAFLTRLALSGDQLDYSAFIGGSDWDAGRAVVVRPDNLLYLAGWSRWSMPGASDFPVTAGSFDESHNGDYDIFILTYQFPADQRLFLPVVTAP